MDTRLFILPLALAMISSCGEPQKGVAQTVDAAQAATEKPALSESAAQRKVLISTGVIRSANEIMVYSRIEGQLLDVNLIEGRKVKAGDTMFCLDDWELKGKVEVSEASYEQARLRTSEILVGQGYKRDNLDAVPESTMQYAKIKSGENTCLSELEFNRQRLEKATIKAPVSGVITGIKAVSYAFVKPGETLCKIVDPYHLIIEFSVLETELRKFTVGTVVDVRSIAYSEVEHKATVRSIGSVVDESGMVRVEAELSDCENLLPGMTATVIL